MRVKIENYFAVGVALLFIAAIVREVVIDRTDLSAAEEQRRHVFCELLKEGMTRAEVHEVLAQFGPFEEHQSDFTGDYTLRVVYANTKTKHQFADGVLLWFKGNDWYMGASIQVSLSDQAPLCQESG